MRVFSYFLGFTGVLLILFNGYSFITSSSPQLIEAKVTTDENSGLEDKESISRYDTKLKEGELVGTIHISSIDFESAVYYGTEENELKKGIGHYKKSALPGEQRHTVFAGHRDTSFRKLEKLRLKEGIIVKTGFGDFLYKVKKIRIVNKDDPTVLVEKPRATLSLITCYPFSFIGNAPQRYVVEAELIRKL